MDLKRLSEIAQGLQADTYWQGRLNPDEVEDLELLGYKVTVLKWEHDEPDDGTRPCDVTKLP